MGSMLSCEHPTYGKIEKKQVGEYYSFHFNLCGGFCESNEFLCGGFLESNEFFYRSLACFLSNSNC